MDSIDERDKNNNINLKINLSDNKTCYKKNHNNLYKHLNNNLNDKNKNKEYLKKLQEDINEYNNLKCEFKQFTRFSVFFIIVSFIMILTKKIYKNKYSIDLIFYITFINLLLSLMFHYDYCPHDYKFHLRIMDMITALIIWSIGLYYGNNYTYVIGISMLIIYIIETYLSSRKVSSKVEGMLHSCIHILHPIMMYSVITFL